jgi:thiol-disulfide isomerase/thioredoxin
MNGCKFCEKMKPFIKDTAKVCKNIKILKFNATNPSDQKVIEEFGINGFPHFIAYKYDRNTGQYVNNEISGADVSKYINMLKDTYYCHI